MRKSNDSSKLDRAKIEDRGLADSELAVVTGGRTVGAVSVRSARVYEPYSNGAARSALSAAAAPCPG